MVRVRRNGPIPRLLQVPVRSPQGAVRYQVGNARFHCNALVATSARFRRPTWRHKNKYSLQSCKIACIERYDDSIHHIRRCKLTFPANWTANPCVAHMSTGHCREPPKTVGKRVFRRVPPKGRALSFPLKRDSFSENL